MSSSVMFFAVNIAWKDIIEASNVLPVVFVLADKHTDSLRLVRECL